MYFIVILIKLNTFIIILFIKKIIEVKTFNLNRTHYFNLSLQFNSIRIKWIKLYT